MFPSFPGFENLPIHLEVEQQGQLRSVEVRIEQLPTMPVQAVPVCSFLDSPEQGEWLLIVGEYDIYTLGNPQNLLQTQSVSRGAYNEEEERIRLNPKRVEKLQGVIKRALNARLGGVRVLRVAQLSNLPHEPYIAAVNARDGFWLNRWKSTKVTRFATPDFDLYSDGARLQQWIQERWDNPNSDVRFAWQWANWSDEERKWHCYGDPNPFEPRKHELEQVMRWILLSTTSLWAKHYGWRWDWEVVTLEAQTCLHNIIYWEDRDRIFREFHDDLHPWEEWLWTHFAPNWRADWLLEHPCVRWFWNHSDNNGICCVEIIQAPTMHEQLEARLLLKDWLQGKTTPDEANRLISRL